MNKTNHFRIFTVFLAVLLFLTALPMTTLVAYAQNEIDDANAVKAAEDAAAIAALTPAQSIEKEMAERAAITKTRPAMKESSDAGIYVDGKLVYEGSFKETWKKTLSNYAPNISSKHTAKEIEALPVVEFVLNKDVKFESSMWFEDNFENGAMYIAHQKVTIDLNGHLLQRDKETAGYADSVIWINDESVVTIMDSNPTVPHKGKIENNLWKPDKNGDVILYGGIICGGAARSRGGGIFINNSSVVYMTGGTVAGNDATAGSGIFLGEKCYLDMSKGTSQVCYNSCFGSLQDGGAIYMSGTGPILNGGYIHHNYSDDYGGGIMADDEHFSILNAVVYANKACEEGGGIYIGDERGSNSIIMNTRIVGNYSGERGGGVYLYSHTDEVKMTNCTVENNASKEHGGGICVSDYRGVDLTISGKMIVRNNYKSSESGMGTASDKSNLYLQGDEDLVIDSVTEGSEVWIRTGTTASEHTGKDYPITEGMSTQDARYFYSDNVYYSVYYNDDHFHDNFHRFYLKGGTVRQPFMDVQVLDNTDVVDVGDYEVTINGEVEEFPLYKGVFEYNLMSTSDFSSASPFYYSDGYFMGDPTVYNEHLATMSINMAVAAFGRGTKFVEGNSYANHFANVKQLFADIGCEDKNFYANEDYQMKPTYYGDDGRLSTIGFAMSQKDIKFDGETYTLVPIAIRGGSYEVEWASNVTLGNSGEAAGFADAADQVTQHVKNYINDYGLSKQLEEGKVKFWIVGYSRAGATANLTSKRLVDAYGALGNQVYGYTFEAPRGAHFEGMTLEEAIKKTAKDYPTIHNTINENDFVTLVAPMEMNFIRYGVDHLVGADHENNENFKSSAYLARRDKMLTQLRAINPYFHLNDRWAPGDVNIIKGALLGFRDVVVPVDEDECDEPCTDIYDYLRWFFYMVQGEGLDLPKEDGEYDMSLSREYYSEKPLLGGNDKNAGRDYSDSNYNFGYSSMSVEEAVCGFMVLMNTIEDETMSELMSVFSGVSGTVVNRLILENVPLQLTAIPSAAMSFVTISGIFVAGAVGASASILAALGIGMLGGLAGLLTAAVVYIGGVLIFALDFYYSYVYGWADASEATRKENLNELIHMILDPEDGKKSIWDVLNPEQAKIVAEGLPVVLYFLLNYISNDNHGTAGMNGLGTFLYNKDFIVSSHYQEVSVAWVRSYDSFYANDTQAYKLEKSAVEAPKGNYAMATNTLSLSAEPGSSIFYSIDEGETWSLYTKPVVLEEEPDFIKAYAISRGVKSIEEPIDKNPWTGSVFGEGNIWFVIISSIAVIGIAVAVVESNRRKKKKIEDA